MGCSLMPTLSGSNLQSSKRKINDLDNVRAYLQEFTTNAHAIVNNTNFQTEVHQFYLDLCSIGTAIMTIEPNPHSIVHFATRHISECVISENNLGMVEELHRTFEWDARQVIEEFGKDKFGEGADIDKLPSGFTKRS